MEKIRKYEKAHGKKDTFQYVPIIETLTSIMHNKDLYEEVKFNINYVDSQGHDS